MRGGTDGLGVDAKRAFARLPPMKECIPMHVSFFKQFAVILAATILFLSYSGPVGAFQPANQNDLYEIPLPDFDFSGHESYEQDVGSRLAVRSAGRFTCR